MAAQSVDKQGTGQDHYLLPSRVGYKAHSGSDNASDDTDDGSDNASDDGDDGSDNASGDGNTTLAVHPRHGQRLAQET